jgi:uncharacterized membrane protein
MKKLLYLLLLCLFTVTPTLADTPLAVTVQSNKADSGFRDHLTFTLSATSPTEIKEVFLFYKVIGQIAISRNEATFTSGVSIEASFKLDQTLPANYMPPGTEVEYWWKLVGTNGEEFKTDQARLLYLDDRHEWQSQKNDRLTIYWYEGDAVFGQALFDRANVALDTLQTDLKVNLKDPIKIFIYASHDDLMSALSAGAQEWTGGVAFTEFGVVVIGIEPDALDWGLRAMSHEMTHLVIHQATNNPYSDLPRWLDEGVAVYNEDKNELVDDFKPVLDEAIKQDKLMTLRTLSSPFPSDPLQANLAYGQSGAMVKFMVDKYGAEAMGKLLEIFSEGALYDEALKGALGTDSDGLYNAWRVSVNLPPMPGTESNMPTVEAQVQTQAEATPAPVATAVVISPTQTAPMMDNQTTLLLIAGLCCCFGGLVLLVIGVVVVMRRARG